MQVKINNVDAAAWRHVTYVPNDSRVGRFVEREYERGRELAGDFARRTLDAAESAYRDFKESNILAKAQAALRRGASFWQSNTIRRISDFHGIQNAPPKMKRWLMAEPETRRLYHRDRCAGYGKSYVDLQPGKVGEDHDDWCKVYNGIFREDDSGEFAATTYFNSTEFEDDVELTFDEQCDIIETHEVMRAGLKYGKDVVCKHDSDL